MSNEVVSATIDGQSTKVLVTEQFKLFLDEYCIDHLSNFKRMPSSFQYEGAIIIYDDFIKFVSQHVIEVAVDL